MKKFLLVLGVLGLACLLFGCGDNATQDQSTAADPQAIYDSALEVLAAEPALELTVYVKTETTQAGNTFLEESQQTITLTGRGTANFAAAVKETLQIGNSASAFAEYYKDDSAYVTVNGVGFTAAMTPEEYLDRLIPAVLLDPALYGKVEAQDNGPAKKLVFSEATAPEGWLGLTDVVLQSATGTASVNTLGHLTDSTYKAEYTAGDAKVAKTVNIHINAYTDPVAAPPADTVNFLTVEDIDAPKALERACSLLLAAEGLSAQVDNQLSCDAGQRHRTEDISLTYSGSGKDLIAQVDTAITIVDGEGGKTATRNQQETYRSGLYNIAQEGKAPEQKSDVTDATMRKYCRSIMTRYILLPGHIAGVKATDTPEGIRIDFTANEACIKLLRASVCNSLYSNEEELEAVASGYATRNADAYILLDRNTGFLLGSGIDHKGVYTVDGTDYALDIHADLTYTLS